jgi:hypothetical protein
MNSTGSSSSITNPLMHVFPVLCAKAMHQCAVFHHSTSSQPTAGSLEYVNPNPQIGIDCETWTAIVVPQVGGVWKTIETGVFRCCANPICNKSLTTPDTSHLHQFQKLSNYAIRKVIFSAEFECCGSDSSYPSKRALIEGQGRVFSICHGSASY